MVFKDVKNLFEHQRLRCSEIVMFSLGTVRIMFKTENAQESEQSVNSIGKLPHLYIRKENRIIIIFEKENKCIALEHTCHNLYNKESISLLDCSY